MKVHVIKFQKAALENYNPEIVDTFESDEEYEKILSEQESEYYENLYNNAVQSVAVVNETPDGRWLEYYTQEEIYYPTYA